MLVFTRAVGESIEILLPNSSEKIVVKVTRLGDKKCKLAFSAPKEIKILRSELKGVESGSDSI